jgi:hypothetical protein
MKKLSPRFEERWLNENRSLDISEYEECLNEWRSGYQKISIQKWVVTILLFCAGLWALYENSTFMAVLLLALSANSQLMGVSHIVLSEIMNQNQLLAMLINKQSRDNESFRREMLKQKESNLS